MSMPWGILLATAHADCGDPAALLTVLEAAVVEGRWSDVDPASDAVVAAFGCGPLAAPEHIARVWLAEALLDSAHGDDPAADESLWAAARISPSTWNEAYGPRLRARWEAASARSEPARGLLHLDPALPAGWIGAVDGAVLDFPAHLPGGPHLLQVGTAPDRMTTARIVLLPPGLDLRVALDLPATPIAPTPMPMPVAPEPSGGRRARRIVSALIVGGVSAGLYGVTIGTSAVYRGQPEGERSDGLRVANNALLVGSSGLALTSGVLLVRGLVTP